MNNVIKLFTDGEVQTKDNRKFTRLVGGFGDNNPMFTIFQAGELIGLETKAIRQNFEKNENKFEESIDFIDLKSASISNASQNNIDTTKFMINMGYSQSKLNATKRWLAFSFSGMMKLVKIATTKESWDIYDNFLEDYFKIKVENIVMKKSIDDEIEELKKDKAMFIGMSIIEKDEVKQMLWLRKMEDVSNRIIALEKTKSEQEIIERYKAEITLGKDICNSNNCYDIAKFSKVLDIKNMGRNKMFDWLRNNGILRHNNEPYQQYMEYFKVIPINDNQYVSSKTLIKASGIKYIINKLIKDNKITTKSVDEILRELEPIKLAS